jgi:hypothetical protein
MLLYRLEQLPGLPVVTELMQTLLTRLDMQLTG